MQILKWPACLGYSLLEGHESDLNAMIWYEDDIQYLEDHIRPQVIDKKSVVFYGSSSIRLWPELQQSFPKYHIVNMGFGGSTLAGCGWFVDRVFKDISPKALVFYAGDNDLGDGRHPEEVYLFFEAFYAYIRYMHPKIPFTFISVKPSPNRLHLVQQMKLLNEWVEKSLLPDPHATFIDVFSRMSSCVSALSKLYTEDGLHMNSHGYTIWRDALLEHEAEVFGA